MKQNNYKIEIKLLTNMLGTSPKNKIIYETYIESKKPKDILDSESETIEEIEESGWTGFHKNSNGELFVYDYFIKGFLKCAGNILVNQIGVKQLKSKINNFVFVSPREIKLGKTEPDGICERPLRGMTAQGPRTALARSDYIKAGTLIKFELTIIDNKEINIDIIEKVLEYGELSGLGQWRGGGFGRFEVLSVEQIV